MLRVAALRSMYLDRNMGCERFKPMTTFLLLFWLSEKIPNAFSLLALPSLTLPSLLRNHNK